MGKGDRKSKKGKRWRGSFGNVRKKSNSIRRIKKA
jgi:ribosomal small subunit protein bTHX